METSTNKTRTSSRCREWERQRRNKFNDAISKLGEVVKAINDANNSDNESENVQYPKIEIIQKAILCLTNCAQEKTQLKAEILALQVKLETSDKQKSNKKDASTQVYIGKNRKSRKSHQNGKYVKLMMLQKSKHNGIKEKTVLTTKNTEKLKENSKQNTSFKKFPKLLPRSVVNNKNGPENTFVVLPASPYIFPQRPLLLPSVPPAIVLVDPNIQTLNKSVSIVNRNGSDVTKTTMVNILPITAYSRPLSATKIKKNSIKSKSDNTKKNKRAKPTAKIAKEPSIVNNENLKLNVHKAAEDNKEESKSNDSHLKNDKEELVLNKESNAKTTYNEIATTEKDNNDATILKTQIALPITTNSDTKKYKNSDIPKITSPTKNNDLSIIGKTTSSSVPLSTTEKPENNINIDKKRECNKIISEKRVAEDKDKENKLSNILDTSLCESTVDGGNARLELAEEFLAASPTAAFLMSFPLVSGNRSDSPAEESQNTMQSTTKDNNQRRNEITTQTIPYFEKPSNTEVKNKVPNKSQIPSNVISKQNEHKYINNTVVNNNFTNKLIEAKSSNTIPVTTVSTENPFLNLPMSSLISTSCTLTDPTFGLDFDCNITKTTSNQSTSYASNNNLFYKSDPFSTVKSTIYSTSSISSGHEFNGLGLYPCAMEKYTSKNKPDYANVEDNLIKIGSSRLTYDIDLGWSHKSFDFVNCTTSSNTFNKDNILTTASAPYSTTYNPFNPEFHVSLVSSSNKKDILSKSNTISETVTNFYSQPTSLWTEDVPFYTNNNVSKTLTTKSQNYIHVDNTHTNINLKPSATKQYETKQTVEPTIGNIAKPSNIGIGTQISDKYTKKSPNKMHINWMTSEIRPMQNNCNPSQTEVKQVHKPPYAQIDHVTKKQDHNESNFFPISIHNYSAQTVPEEFQVWPSTRPLGTTEISIEPPPINLPTLVGDLALGPHDKKKTSDLSNKGVSQTDIQNCGNFLSVTQLMNRSTDNMPSRYQGPNIETGKPNPTKHNNAYFNNDINRKIMTSRLESSFTQPCYVFNDTKTINSYDNMSQYAHTKIKTNKSDKNSKVQKNSYSAEALIRGATCNQKVQDNISTRCVMPQKFNDFNAQDNSVAQVSHYPPILDYSDNSYAGQQYSGTTLYNSTTNTISNSFYSNFMPGTSNLMASNYSAGFTGDFIDYNQTTECNYSNHKYEELKMRNNPTVFHQDKVPSNYKASKRDSTTKHKLECSKKESSKKYQNKRPKLNNEVEEWNESSHLLWQNKTPSKRHSNMMSDELPFPNYVSNQMPTQYQPDFFNSHLMPSNVQSVGHNVDRSLTSFPVTSRANFNLSTIFPEITMKVQ